MYVLRSRDQVSKVRAYFKEGWGWDAPLSEATLHEEIFDSEDGVFLTVVQAQAIDGTILAHHEFIRKIFEDYGNDTA